VSFAYLPLWVRQPLTTAQRVAGRFDLVLTQNSSQLYGRLSGLNRAPQPLGPGRKLPCLLYGDAFEDTYPQADEPRVPAGRMTAGRQSFDGGGVSRAPSSVRSAAIRRSVWILKFCSSVFHPTKFAARRLRTCDAFPFSHSNK
jgi:hypothetical protein